jgi:ABC-2 type transport system permease protein
MMRVIWALTVASLKMFVRQREAVLWGVLLPVFMIVLFSFVKFDGIGHLEVGLVAGGNGGPLLDSLRSVSTFSLHEGSRDAEMQELKKGERAMVVVLPAVSDSAGRGGGVVQVFTNDERIRETQLGTLILQRVLDESYFRSGHSEGRLLVSAQPVQSRNLTYIDFLLPGVLAMTIMQMGIFGVAFGFVTLKKRGILRRLWVTPINPADFIIAQVATRVFALVVQLAIMVAVGIIFLHIHFIGSYVTLLLIALLGSVVFLAMGFAIAGIARSEDQVPPMANIISLPMLLLSGVFFSRAGLPGAVRAFTDFLPLTYLVEALRGVAVDGASLTQVGPALGGLAVWAVLSVGIAVKMFRWE